jgi:hypothetical protein
VTTPALQRMDTPAEAFLRALWTDQPRGFIQIWTLSERRSVYLSDPAAAANFAGQPDVFCAVGMTTTRLGAKQRAKASQVAAIAGMWLDLDVGEGGVPTREDAFEVAAAHLAPTILIDSGHGIHAWYLLPEPWIFTTREQQTQAASLARRFVALHAQTAARSGWRIDSVGDLARLMRLPGTLNAKDPAAPRPVVWLGLDSPVGPRHTLNVLRHVVEGAAVLGPEPRARARAPVTLTGDTSAFAAKLDALLANSPEFQARWTHDSAPRDGSMSAYDLSLCSLAAGAMTDPELATLIRLHRSLRGSAADKAKGRRHNYLQRTIALARGRTERDGQIAALENLGRRVAQPVLPTTKEVTR